MAEPTQPQEESSIDSRAILEGLVPFIIEFITKQWDWRPWRTQPPPVPLHDGGPSVLPPGYVLESDWSIAFEGVYGWALDFAAASLKDGPLKSYLDGKGVYIEVETGYAISLGRAFVRPDV